MNDTAKQIADLTQELAVVTEAWGDALAEIARLEQRHAGFEQGVAAAMAAARAPHVGPAAA